jgi:hypothetical protein
MQQLVDTNNRQIVLLVPAQGVKRKAQRQALLDFTVALALRGPVRVLDAGNCFDPYHIARAIRRETAELDAVMGRIFVARAFTCYQVITLLQQTPSAPMPHIIFDLLATFSDQAVTYSESRRLLQIGIQQLQRLRRKAPVIVSAGARPAQQREGLLRTLESAADLVLLPDTPAATTLERLL